MDFSTIAAAMWPFWVFGATMIFVTKKSEHKDLMRIEPKIVFQWSIFLIALTIIRVTLYRLLPDLGSVRANMQSSSEIPWQMTFFVFWEDACHGLPLVLLKRMIGTKWFTYPIHFVAMLMVMFSFGMGHTYQGISAAITLSFYIPLSVSFGSRRGFGTIMLNHILYDLSTVLFLKWMT